MSEDPILYHAGCKSTPTPINDIPPNDYEKRMIRRRGQVGLSMYLTNRMADSFLAFVKAGKLDDLSPLQDPDGRNVKLFLYRFAEMIERSYRQFPVQTLPDDSSPGDGP